MRSIAMLAISLQPYARGADLLEPVVARFCECLDEIEACYEELADKVDDLQSRLVGLLPPETD